MIQKEILPSGLRLMLVPNKATSVVTIIVMFGVGSRYEPENQAGISHILEHMQYKGTEKRPTAMAVAEFIESIGGEHNAFTGKEYTGYYVKVAPKHLNKALDFLSDNLLHSKLDQKELDREKGVIIEEVNMYEDSPMDLVGSRFEESLFGPNSLGRDIIGYKKSIAATTREDLADYRKTYYTGPNAVIILAGNFGSFSEDEVKETVLKSFNFSSAIPSDLPPIILDQEKSVKITDKKTEQSHLVIGFYGAPYGHPDQYKLKLLSTILGGSMSSRMFEEIREKRGLAYAVRTSSSSYSDTGTIETQVGVPHEKLIETIKAVLAEYGKIRDKGVTETELRKAKEIVSGRMLISFEDSLDLALYYAMGEIVAGQVVTPEELVKIYEKITTDDIINVAQKYLRDEMMSLAYIGPSLTAKQLEPIFKL